MMRKEILIGLFLLWIGVACAGESAATAVPPAASTPERQGTPLADLATAEPPAVETLPTADTVPPALPTDVASGEPAATTVPATATMGAQAIAQVSVRPIANGFFKPVYVTHAGDGRLFVVEQHGVIKIVANGEVLATPFLDIQSRVNSGASEQGFLGLAFHPDYANDGAVGHGRFFVYYTRNDGAVVIARYQVSPAPNIADFNSETILLTVAEPYNNHNGGQLAFGPDGYLYAGLGDGGSGGDPDNNGQKLSTLLGTVLRLDVDAEATYVAPADNPFVGMQGQRDAIWLYGLRNPWRFSFDRVTGDVFVADVGQNIWEEVSWLPAGEAAGANLGWNILEGTHCYGADTCDASGTVLPVVDYDHSEGCSVTGGYIYRGQAYPALTGNYFFGDYCTGVVWALFDDGAGWGRTAVYQGDHLISSFGEDVNGEIYLVDHKGSLWQLQP